MKRNLNMPGFKLKHMNTPLLDKKPLPEARKEKTPVKPTNILTADKRPSFLHNNGVISSAGGDEATDSIASVKAFNELKQSYMKRKFKGNDERLGPITPEQNLAEYNREKGEFYFNPSEGKLKLIPTDDAEMQDLTGIKSYQLAPKNK